MQIMRLKAKIANLKNFRCFYIDMTKLSEKTKKLLKDDILSLLYNNPFKAMFTNEIAREIRRDNEFVKKLLLELKAMGLVENVKTNIRGKRYKKRMKWRIPLKLIKAMENKTD